MRRIAPIVFVCLGCAPDDWRLAALPDGATDAADALADDLADAPAPDAFDAPDAPPSPDVSDAAPAPDVPAPDVPPAPDVIAVQPASATLLVSARPRLLWRAPAGTSVTLRVCRAPACAAGDVVRESAGPFAATGRLTAWDAPAALAPGRYWWSVDAGAAGRTVPRWFEVPPGTRAAGPSAAGRVLPDLDGDGRTEVLAGAVADPRGAFQVVDPRDRSVRATPAPEAAGQRFGERIAVAGDTDGDGRQEVLVADPPSRAWVFYAGPDGRFTRAVMLAPPAPGGVFAATVAGVGDVDGDGYADVAASLHLPTATSVQLYHGSPAGVRSAPTASLLGTGTTRDNLMGLAGAGDRDGDGDAEIAVGLPVYTDPGGDRSNNGRGHVMLFHGDPSGPRAPAAPASLQAGFSNWGRTLAGFGDLDGDGVGDVLHNGETASALVFRGPANLGVAGWGPAQLTPAACAYAPGASIAAQAAVAPAGDVNGDGFDDVLHAVPGRCGAVYFGRAAPAGSSPNPPMSGTPANWDIASAAVLLRAGEVNFGAAVAGPGDVNGDGLGDMVIASPRPAGGGALHVYYGHRGAPATMPDVTIDDPSPGFATSLAR
ncbi:MAG: FG-GAP-like repeat-containing protein [Polyangiales bacterium]